jgi:hypothetical protein
MFLTVKLLILSLFTPPHDGYFPPDNGRPSGNRHLVDFTSPFIYHEFLTSGEKPRLKFKIFFILFNSIITLFLFFVFILPGFFPETDFAGVFWRGARPLAVILVLVLLGMDVFYFYNRRLFYLLEREDWPNLVQYLEDRVVKRGRYSSLAVGFLANAYMVLSDYRAVRDLEEKTAAVKPRLADANALVFGVARILEKDYEGAFRFFEEKAGKVKPGIAAWVRWYAGFARFLNKGFSQAADRFAGIAGKEGDAALAGLSSYFLAASLSEVLPDRGPELMAAAMDGRKRVRAALPGRDAWNKEIDKIRGEVYVAVLSEYLDKTAEWLYHPNSNENAGVPQKGEPA